MNKDIVYVRRLKDGAVMDIPKRDLEETLKRGFELVEDEIVEEAEEIASEILEESKPTEFTCALCQKIYKTEKALEKHIKIHR